MSLDLFRAHHFLALPPLLRSAPKNNPTPSTPKWVSIVVISQEINESGWKNLLENKKKKEKSVY